MRHRLLTLLLLTIVCTQTAHALSDELWICHEDTILKTGERAIINEYTVKVHGFTPPPNGTSTSMVPESVSLVLYRNTEFVQMFDIPEGGDDTYFGKVKLKVIDIDFEKDDANDSNSTNTGTVRLQVFIFGDEPLWNKTYGPVTMSENEIVVIDDYVFKIGKISDDGVDISAIKELDVVANNSFIKGSKKTYFDNILVRTTDIENENKNKKVIVEVYRKGSADISVDAHTKKDTYTPDQIIFYNILVDGTDTLPLRDVDVNITVMHDSKIIETYTKHLRIVSSSINYTLRKTTIPPATPQGIYLSISANASGFDYKGIEHFANTSKELAITPYLSMTKSISTTDAILNKSKRGQLESIRMTTTITNHANFTSPTLTLFEEIPQEFHTDTDGNTPKWILSIGALDTKEITYNIIPKKQGEYNLPPARIEWVEQGENYVIHSNDVKLAVHAPVITAIKSTAYLENGIKVTIYIENKGDLAADVEVNDEIPDGVELIGGTTSWKRMLKPGGSGEYSYTIQQGRNKEHTLLPAIASYVDVEGILGTVHSNSITIGRHGVVEEDKKEPTTSPSMLAVFLIKAFLTISAISAIPALAAHTAAKRHGK